ncbi:hypothetical protein D3C81_702570 [compost metagenome]
MPGIWVAAPQPITGCATGPQTDCHQAGQATEYLSPGKSHAAGTSYCQEHHAGSLPKKSQSRGDEGRIRYTCICERLSEVLY